MANDWDLRSNIKGKPGSQGTLFQGGRSQLNPQQRWPRGYTPERQEAVREGMKDAWGRRTAVYGAGDHSDESQRARVVDTVARSTIPESHLFGLETIDSYPDKGTVGTYRPRKAHLSVDMHTRNEGDAAGQTLVHELGHHHVASDRGHNIRTGQLIEEVAMRDKHVAPFRSPTGDVNSSGRLMAESQVNPGVHEAAADNYMVEHYRTRGRNPKPVEQGAYEQSFTTEQMDKHYPGYTDVRPPKNLSPSQFSQETLF